MSATPVGILGATGMVGQQFIALLADHPWFKVEWLGASQRSEGKAFRDAAAWRLPNRLPEDVARRTVEAAAPGSAPKLVFSGLDSSVAGEIEAAFANAGHIVVSNSRNYRMDASVPLLIPEVNADHLALLEGQAAAHGWKGRILTNPNCATVVLAMALAPLRQFGLKTTMVTTLQAISGAGYPGVPSWDILGNIIPHIGGGEEEKIETETKKILGCLTDGQVDFHPVTVSATTTRVPVQNGHTGSIAVGLEQKPSPEAIIDAWNGFRGRPQELDLPSAPAQPLVYMTEINRPQPLLDANRDNGMAVTVGRLRPCPLFDYKFVALGHNTIRGAAGAAILNAEILHREGRLWNVIMKFGGTSVADPEAMGRVVDIVLRRLQEHPDARVPVIVVSAMSKVTDRLVETARLAGEGQADGAATTLNDLLDWHLGVARALVPNEPFARLSSQLNEDFAVLTGKVRGMAAEKTVLPRQYDELVALGELASSRIVADALAARGVPAVWVDARRVLVTDDEHTAALPDMEATCRQVESELGAPAKAGQVPVLGGFIGATPAGLTTTLGRGGSDYSAAVFGACLDVDEIQIWTDVDGMLSADPRVVDAPNLVPQLSFAEASELAYFGAKVLHPSTILPAVARNIPVRILNSRRPEVAGTLITADGRDHDGLTALACKRGVTVVDITSTRMLMAHGFLRRLFEVFERYRTPVDVVTTSEVSVSVTVDNAKRLPEVLAELRNFADVNSEPHMAIVCVVGEKLRSDATLFGRAVTSLGRIPLRLVSQAASRRNITFVMRDQDVPEAMNLLHREFFQRVSAETATGGRR